MSINWFYKFSLAVLNLAIAAMLHAQGTAFTYQGRLSQGGSTANGTYDFRFRLAADPLGNNYVGGSILSNALPVSGGLFTVMLDFGAGVLMGSNYWLEVDVRTNGAAGYNTLAPLQRLTPSPYAIFANSAGTAGSLSGILPSGQLAGTYSSAVSLNNASNSFTGGFDGDGSNVTNVNAATLGGFGANQFWKTTGNSNTVTGVNFLGTTDDRPLELWSKGLRVLRLEADPRGGIAGNLIGGCTNNAIEQPASGGDFIGGGGYLEGPNVIHTNSSGDFIGAGSANQIGPNAGDSVIAGGFGNIIYPGTYGGFIGGGEANQMNNVAYSAIAGGLNNSVNTSYSFVGAGYQNTLQTSARFSVVGGGEANMVLTGADHSVVGGGSGNTNGAAYATVPGGYANYAGGQFSFAAGRRAKATADGAFVWADSLDADFSSTTTNQFNARANGGVRFVTGGAGMTLDGQTVATTNALTNLNAASITSGTLPDVRLSVNVALRSGGNAFTGQQVVTDGSVGVGTSSPQAPLHVRGGYGSQLVLQDNVLGHSWSINNDANDNLVFVPNTGTGGYIYRGNGNYFSLSDLRLKQDVQPLGGVLDRVLQLRPVSYHFRSAPEGTPLTLGFIAQEVEPLFPELVGERNGMKSLSYTELVPVTIGAIQELNQKVEDQKGELKRKETEIIELKQRLEALEQIVLSQKTN
jgi:hypothetical protein